MAPFGRSYSISVILYVPFSRYLTSKIIVTSSHSPLRIFELSCAPTWFLALRTVSSLVLSYNFRPQWEQPAPSGRSVDLSLLNIAPLSQLVSRR